MSHPMKKKVLTRYWQSKGRGTGQLQDQSLKVVKLTQWPSPGSALQRWFANVFFTPSRWGALLYLPQLVPLLVSNRLLQFLTLVCPSIFWGRFCRGKSHSRKHFESVNVMSREKLSTQVQSTLTELKLLQARIDRLLDLTRERLPPHVHT